MIFAPETINGTLVKQLCQKPVTKMDGYNVFSNYGITIYSKIRPTNAIQREKKILTSFDSDREKTWLDYNLFWA